MVGRVFVIVKRLPTRMGKSGESRLRKEKSATLWCEACSAEMVMTPGMPQR